MVWRILLLVVGVYAGSTAVIMIKACQVHPMLLAAYRQLIAAAALSPLFLRDLLRHRGRYGWREVRRTVVPGLMLGAHFITWIIGARLTWAANSSLIVNMVPIVMPFLLYVLIRERLTRGEWAGTAVAMAGVLLLGATDFRVSAAHFAGDAICLGSMFLFAIYLALGRRNRDFATIWLYLVPLYTFGGLACLLLAVTQVRPGPLTFRDGLLVTGLGVVPTVIGHSVLNHAMKHLRGQLVSLVNLGQFVFAGVMGFFLLGELPQVGFYPACVMVVGGAVLALRSPPRRIESPP